jgi:hypothetical protein
MPSEIAKRVAGTYVADNAAPNSGVLAWVTAECREGQFEGCIKRFCQAQEEILDPALVVVETVSAERIQCTIPCRLFDHESTATFLSEVKFTLDPATGAVSRLRIPV